MLESVYFQSVLEVNSKFRFHHCTVTIFLKILEMETS